MPEFHLDTSGAVEALPLKGYAIAPGAWRWSDLSAFTQGYVEALFFTEEDQLRHPDTGPGIGDGDYSFASLAPETLATIMADCRAFRYDNRLTLTNAYDTDDAPGCDQAGRDFWYTRNGHGCGFWDGDWPEPCATALTEAARAFGQADVYLGNDGKVYL